MIDSWSMRLSSLSLIALLLVKFAAGVGSHNACSTLNTNCADFGQHCCCLDLGTPDGSILPSESCTSRHACADITNPARMTCIRPSTENICENVLSPNSQLYQDMVNQGACGLSQCQFRLGVDNPPCHDMACTGSRTTLRRTCKSLGGKMGCKRLSITRTNPVDNSNANVMADFHTCIPKQCDGDKEDFVWKSSWIETDNVAVTLVGNCEEDLGDKCLRALEQLGDRDDSIPDELRNAESDFRTCRSAYCDPHFIDDNWEFLDSDYSCDDDLCQAEFLNYEQYCEDATEMFLGCAKVKYPVKDGVNAVLKTFACVPDECSGKDTIKYTAFDSYALQHPEIPEYDVSGCGLRLSTKDKNIVVGVVLGFALLLCIIIGVAMAKK